LGNTRKIKKKRYAKSVDSITTRLHILPFPLSFSFAGKNHTEKCSMHRRLHGLDHNNSHQHLPIKANSHIIIIIIPTKIVETAKYIEIPGVSIATQQPLHYGDVMMMAIIYVMPVVFITNCIMYIVLSP